MPRMLKSVFDFMGTVLKSLLLQYTDRLALLGIEAPEPCHNVPRKSAALVFKLQHRIEIAVRLLRNICMKITRTID